MGYSEVVTSVINGGLLQADDVRTGQDREDLYPYVRYLSVFLSCLTWDFFFYYWHHRYLL